MSSTPSEDDTSTLEAERVTIRLHQATRRRLPILMERHGKTKTDLFQRGIELIEFLDETEANGGLWTRVGDEWVKLKLLG